MTKPMYCPMSYHARHYIDEDYCGYETSEMVECTPDCAWAVVNTDEDTYMCCVPSALGNRWKLVNSRPLKDDAE